MRRTSTLRHVYDERLFDMMRARSRVTTPDQRTIMREYVMEGRRNGWTWALIADALRCSPSSARRWANAS